MTTYLGVETHNLHLSKVLSRYEYTDCVALLNEVDWVLHLHYSPCWTLCFDEHLNIFDGLAQINQETRSRHRHIYSLHGDSNIKEITTSFLNFIVLKSTENKAIMKLSPFAIERYLSANVAPTSLKTTCNNTLIVEITKKKYAELLLKMTTLHNMKIKAYPHRSL